MLHFRGEVSISFLKHHKDCAILVAPIVVLNVCRFYMDVFLGFPVASVLHASKIVFCVQLFRFRVHGKSATNAQIDRQITTDRLL